jgi:23S rRNA (pseudouridine1915-N3)-methyltransferase
MYKLKVYSVGKTKETWLQEALQEYEVRLRSSLALDWILAKNTEQLKQFLEKEEKFLCLDPAGKQFSSEEFSAYLLKTLENNHSRLAFIIGGAEGLPQEIKSRSQGLISFSKMTFTHQMTRLILVEQLYRALEIAKGTGYHK